MPIIDDDCVDDYRLDVCVLGGSRVAAEPCQGVKGSAAPKAVSGPGGHFTLEGVAAGCNRIKTLRDGFMPARLPRIDAEPAGTMLRISLVPEGMIVGQIEQNRRPFQGLSAYTLEHIQNTGLAHLEQCSYRCSRAEREPTANSCFAPISAWSDIVLEEDGVLLSGSFELTRRMSSDATCPPQYAEAVAAPFVKKR